ncbi:MAG: hypothetical protein WAV11_03535 [Minisyncoccia bacterium]
MGNFIIFFDGKEDIELIKYKDEGKFLGYEIVPLIKVSKIGIEENKGGFKNVYFFEVDNTTLVIRTLNQNGFPHLCIGTNFDIVTYLNQFYRPFGFSLQLGKPARPFSEIWWVKKGH